MLLVTCISTDIGKRSVSSISSPVQKTSISHLGTVAATSEQNEKIINAGHISKSLISPEDPNAPSVDSMLVFTFF